MRHFQLLAGIGVVALLVVSACAPAAAPSPTAPPAKPAATSAPPPQPAPTAAAAAKPAATQAAQPAASPAAKPAASPVPKPAFDEKAVADFYKGKTVRMIVGFGAGGGYDTYTRLIAKHIGRQIPGNPTVIVENMPGASSIKAANYLTHAGPQDGTAIANVYGSLVLPQLFEAAGVEYDMGKMQFLGTVTGDTYFMFAHKRTGIAKLEDTFGPNSKQLILGGIAPGSVLDDAPALVKDAFQANIKVVSGYDTTAKIRVAMDGGEVDGFINSWESHRITSMDKTDSGEWVILVQFADKPVADIPGVKTAPSKVPAIGSFAKDEEQRQLFRFGTILPHAFARPYIVGPGVPKDRVLALQQAFDKTMADKEFLADADKGKMVIQALTGDQTYKLATELLGMPSTITAKLKKVMQPS